MDELLLRRLSEVSLGRRGRHACFVHGSVVFALWASADQGSGMFMCCLSHGFSQSECTRACGHSPACTHTRSSASLCFWCPLLRTRGWGTFPAAEPALCVVKRYPMTVSGCFLACWGMLCMHEVPKAGGACVCVWAPLCSVHLYLCVRVWLPWHDPL